jgi:predicted Zn-ribbon and HTH transcriptional regulator
MEQANKPSILSNINHIEKKLKELEKEKEIIQHNCRHLDGFNINFDESKLIKKYCLTCKKDVGFASTQEQQDFLEPRGSQHI